MAIKEITKFVAKAAGGGLLSYVTPRLLVSMGVPLDKWIVLMGGFLSLHFTQEAALWGATFVTGALLFFGDRLLARRERHIHHKELQAESKPVASLGIEVTRAKPLTPTPDITFKEALQHFAYKSRWAHDYQHPPSATLVAEFWPQTVHRVFCQPLIDGDLIAWGVRQEAGKDRENGRTKIPADFWRTAQFDVNNTLESPDMLGWARDSEGTAYSRVMFNRTQIEEVWPAAEGSTTAAIELAAKEWWRLRQIDVALSKAAMAEQLKSVRRAQIAKGRDMAHEFTKTANGDSYGFRVFLEGNRAYADLRRHLSNEFLAKLHQPRTAYVSNPESAYPALVALFLKDLERLERELEL